MKKNLVFAIVLLTLFFGSLFRAEAQSVHNSSSSLGFFDNSSLPQWAKDLRRFDIIAFGSFPFSMFLTNFFYDMHRWNKANGMDFSPAGRRYAPWPLRSAGAVEKTSVEFRRTILIAAGVSLSVALTDYIIVRVKRNREQWRFDDLSPSDGSVDIERHPLRTPEPDNGPPDASGEEVLQTEEYEQAEEPPPDETA